MSQPNLMYLEEKSLFPDNNQNPRKSSIVLIVSSLVSSSYQSISNKFRITAPDTNFSYTIARCNHRFDFGCGCHRESQITKQPFFTQLIHKNKCFSIFICSVRCIYFIIFNIQHTWNVVINISICNISCNFRNSTKERNFIILPVTIRVVITKCF